jgi:hypothetical protein
MQSCRSLAAAEEGDDEDGVRFAEFSVVRQAVTIDQHEAGTVRVYAQSLEQTCDSGAVRYLHIVQVADLIYYNSVQFEFDEHRVSSAIVVQLVLERMGQAA